MGESESMQTIRLPAKNADGANLNRSTLSTGYDRTHETAIERDRARKRIRQDYWPSKRERCRKDLASKKRWPRNVLCDT